MLTSAAAAAVIVAGAYAIRSYNMDASKDERKVFGRGPSFTSLRVHSVENINHDTKRLRFSLPNKNVSSGLGLTSAVLTFSKPSGHLLPVVRPYTPTNNLDEPGYLDLVVKRYPKGKASNHLHSLKPGQSLFFLAAIQGYQWKRNAFSHITLVAGGAGITPMYQLIQGIFNDPKETTKVTLVHGINSDEDAIFRAEFAKYEEDFPERFNVVHTASHPVEASPFRKGYITGDLIREANEKLGGKSDKVFVCGPPAMEAALVGKSAPCGAGGGILGQLGFSRGQIFKF
ncbi:NADH-cytochrome b5 reductase-1 [Coleophoma cylindrospora]|uniref:NADH-cytochrome b5 reductase n=1 Tax=Coleophoma cylindrospora TaxID=1849047 RepID=A0A3D8R2V8_9HELO|nr:NADH-cytochrome b5 reductase-1 [Coleophoma cylindrospora]